jgi:hypothetical protein
VGGLLAVEDRARHLHLDDLAAGARASRAARRPAGSTPTTSSSGRSPSARDRAPGEQPPAADRDDEHVEVGDLLEELQRGGALPGDHVGVIERWQHRRATFASAIAVASAARSSV